MTPSTKRRIDNYFIGDNQESVYKYRTGSDLVEMFDTRFGVPNISTGPSRWTLCDDTIDYMLNHGTIDEFFTTMLTVRNIGKELGESNQTICAAKRKDAIKYLNNILVADDLELIEIGDRLILHHMDDDSDLIGSGGFANIYRVPGTNMVVKKLKDEFKGDEGVVSRFKNEFYLIHEKLVGIEGIITGYEYNPDDISYTMEYCNCDLKKYIENSSLEEGKRVDLILEILETMNQVHERKVLHRDLSPKNIFIKNGHPIIADFGLGKAIDENGRTYVTLDTSMNGTLEYCDPRQFQGLGFADEQSDIYSLGRIINYIMTNNSDNFKHSLSVVSTIATESSLDARFHSIKEMIDKISRITVNRKDTAYINRCEQLLNNGYYDKSMDDYLFSFDEDDLLEALNREKFRKVYMIVASNISNNAITVERFSTILRLCNNPIGHSFALFDGVSYFCIDMLRDHQGITPSLKVILGNCIYAITAEITRYNAQNYFDQNYKHLEQEYIQDSITAAEERKKNNKRY
jgi:serine/threonine protein kinase